MTLCTARAGRYVGVMQEQTPPGLPLPDRVYAPPREPLLVVLHHDPDLLVVDKPSGLLSVPGKHPRLADCVAARAALLYPDARIVHRLDMDTSGVMVLALNAPAHRHLGLQFERRHVSKAYVARVAGHVAQDRGTIDLPLCTDWPNRPRQMVDHEAGRAALTNWRVLEREEHATRVLLEPLTGRSHQLRVHMRELGHPILGDPLYGTPGSQNGAARLQLHAESLTIRHPNGGAPTTFTSSCPF